MSPANNETVRHLDAAKDNLGDAKEALKSGVTEAIDAGAAAAREARLELDDKLQGLMDKGREMLGDAEDLIRSKPLASFGVAFAAGYLLAALTRRK
jgi:ElaB/YqjD/DUF883 family membrane-anchored ribosome-binding protein